MGKVGQGGMGQTTSDKDSGGWGRWEQILALEYQNCVNLKQKHDCIVKF